MAAHVLAIVNMKGGVGKTATVVGLAETLAARGRGPVLVVDVDTQANASYCLAGDAILTELINSKKTIDQFLERKLLRNESASLAHFIRKSVSNTSPTRTGLLDVSLIASSTNLRLSERDILHELTQKGLSLTGIEQSLTNALGEEISVLGEDYNYIIFDCAPGISPFTTAAISLAHLIVVPTIPDFLSFLGLDAFLNSVRRDMTYRAAYRSPHVLITRSTARSKKTLMALWSPSHGKAVKINHHRVYEKRIRDLAKDSNPEFKVFKAMLDETPAMPVAMSIGSEHTASPTFLQKYPSPLGKALDRLSKEIEEILQ